MNLHQAAAKTNTPLDQASSYAASCDAVFEGESIYAVLRGNKAHLAVDLKGLNGRKVLKECNIALSEWFRSVPEIIAPIKHENVKAIRLVKALGFDVFDATATHLLLRQTKEKFNGKS